MGWEVGKRFKREGMYVHLWLIHVDVWQKPTQYCKAIILQLKINKFFLKESHHKGDSCLPQVFWGVDLSPRDAEAMSTSLRIMPPSGGELRDSQEKINRSS